MNARNRLFLLLLILVLGAPTAVLAKEKIRLMYLETDQELRAAVLIHRLELPLEVYRVGVFRVGKNLYGVVRFGVNDSPGVPADKHRIATTAAMLSDRIFGELPDLARLDFEGVSQRETKEQKPDVLFSCSVDRNSWKTIPKAMLALQRLEMVGMLFFDPRIQLGEPVKPPTPPATTKKKAKAAKTPGRTRDKGAKRESQ
jgi:hypothetical protein